MHLTTRIHRHARRCADERGFTMLLAVFVLTVTTLLLGGAYIAVLDDTALSRNDLDQKRAYAAAQAGIQAYNFQLNQNVNYWESCLPASNSSPVTVPGSADAGATETYTIKPLIASTAPSGTTQCDVNNPIATMIEGSSAGTAAGTFRISSTGQSAGVSRTIVAQYRSPSFLNYVYYTDYETLDPSAIQGDPTDCAVHYPNRGGDCQAIQFITGDSIKGPLHSEDTLLVCGSPVFGRTSADQIQAAGHSDENRGNCNDNATMTGTFNSSAPSLLPPSTNAQLLNVTQSAFHFTGVTKIVLNAGQMQVNGGAFVNDPTNGVVYVSTSSAGCPVTYTPFTATYTGNTGCGNVYVSGNYNTPLTIASDNDIIINGNIYPTGTPLTTPATVPTGTALLGLVANDFVRIYHPVVGTRGPSTGSCNDPNNNNSPNVTNDPGSLTDPYIYAAILAVNHSFIVDNFDCGATLGTLHVFGVIAQLFRGPVGTSGSGGSGYLKDYNYDDRLATTEPPYFLNPVSAHWSVSRLTECDVAASC
jgi:Tfp pilus assembly protein PilX